MLGKLLTVGAQRVTDNAAPSSSIRSVAAAIHGRRRLFYCPGARGLPNRARSESAGPGPSPVLDARSVPKADQQGYRYHQLTGQSLPV
jgi:hypothetical protein